MYLYVHLNHQGCRFFWKPGLVRELSDGQGESKKSGKSGGIWLVRESL